MNGKAIGLLAIGTVVLLAIGKKAVAAGPALEEEPPYEPLPPPKVLLAPETPAVTPMPYKPTTVIAPPPTSGFEMYLPPTPPPVTPGGFEMYLPPTPPKLAPTIPTAPTGYVRVTRLGVERVIDAKDLPTFEAAGWIEIPLVPAPIPTPIPMPAPTVVVPSPQILITPVTAAPVTGILSVRNPWGDVVTMPAEEYDPAWEELGWVILAKPPTAEPLPTTPTLFAVYSNRMRHPETGEEQLVPDEDEDLFERQGWVFVERVRIA